MKKRRNPTNYQRFGKKLPKIGEILSAPLVAAASANSVMVREQTKFLMDTCFVALGDNKYEPLMIEMSLKRTFVAPGENENVEKQDIESTFQIPLLTLVPINSLVVDNVNVDFSLEIVSQTANQSSRTIRKEEDSSRKSMLDSSSEQKESVMTGKLSYDSNDKKSNRTHNASKLNVNIHAGSIPLPLGVTALIDLYVKSINAIPKQINQ